MSPNTIGKSSWSVLSVYWLSLCAGLLFASSCNSPRTDDPEAQVELTLSPSPPVVGEAEVELKLSDAEGNPLKGADVRLEGNMNHAGMKPSFADLTEVEPGNYQGTLDFTMGGDWFVLVTAKTQDGKKVERKIDVPGVKSK